MGKYKSNEELGSGRRSKHLTPKLIKIGIKYPKKLISYFDSKENSQSSSKKGRKTSR